MGLRCQYVHAGDQQSQATTDPHNSSFERSACTQGCHGRSKLNVSPAKIMQVYFVKSCVMC